MPPVVDLSELEPHLPLFPLLFTSSVLRLPSLAGKDCSVAVGADDEDERAHPKAAPDERPVHREEETGFQTEHAPEPAGVFPFKRKVCRTQSPAQRWHLNRPGS